MKKHAQPGLYFKNLPLLLDPLLLATEGVRALNAGVLAGCAVVADNVPFRRCKC